MCQVDGEYAKVWRDLDRVARKEHRCTVCQFRIPRGAQYRVVESLYDGSWSRAAMCFACLCTQTLFGDAHHFYPWPDSLDEYLESCIDQEGGEKARDRQTRLWRVLLAQLRRRRRDARIR
jgi:hypothetical protein